MANPWFQFKQFKVEQDRCALKVGTDACILGAWAKARNPARILDIGTGTGLLALMLAQRYQAPIDALEPEPEAAAQAQHNFQNSPWRERLRLHPLKLQDYRPGLRYDLIVCNPPFYPDHLKSRDKKRNLALHQSQLSFEELAQACKHLLSETGLCYILLPPRQAQQFEQLALAQGLFIQNKLMIRDRQDLPLHRCIYSFGQKAVDKPEESLLTIRTPDLKYHPDFQQLLREYYLIF